MERAFHLPGIFVLFCSFVLLFLISVSLPFIDPLDYVRVYIYNGIVTTTANGTAISEILRVVVYGEISRKVGALRTCRANCWYEMVSRTPCMLVRRYTTTLCTNGGASEVTVGSSWMCGLITHPIAQRREVNLLLSRMLEVDWQHQIVLREMRLSIVVIDNFYSPDVLFDDSMTRCPCQAGIQVETDSESLEEEEPEPEPELKELPEAQDEGITSTWSNDSESDMVFATQSVTDKSSWAYSESYAKRDSYARSISCSPDSPLFRSLLLLKAVRVCSRKSGDDRRPSHSACTLFIFVFMTYDDSCSVRSIHAWPTLHAIPDVDPAPALFSEELIPHAQDSSSLCIPGYWIVHSAPGRKMIYFLCSGSASPAVSQLWLSRPTSLSGQFSCHL
ncbi:hypothetical protein SCP_0310380 [Sparassis crispa]|uniref:Uncharacterized protein n=1 Tax=Sparassis crispa TaxID=139825 RepID=A0A401GGR7_9APHY|nr:hypothetical protein SCP_0310380 [Sparassis crispa]GBE81311.1 hypothetical protein SCP_0310380 [Sparassis crispa]